MLTLKALICLLAGHKRLKLGQGTLMGKRGDVTICRRCMLVEFERQRIQRYPDAGEQLRNG